MQTSQFGALRWRPPKLESSKSGNALLVLVRVSGSHGEHWHQHSGGDDGWDQRASLQAIGFSLWCRGLHQAIIKGGAPKSWTFHFLIFCVFVKMNWIAKANLVSTNRHAHHMHLQESLEKALGDQLKEDYPDMFSPNIAATWQWGCVCHVRTTSGSLFLFVSIH